MIRVLTKIAATADINEALFPLPVPTSPESLGKPTSSDIHLYRDPETALEDFPIFFVDSEGLHAGEELPVSQRAVEKLGWHQKTFAAASQRAAETLAWSQKALEKVSAIRACFGVGKSRSSIVGEVFPKLLYTFSDVVCFIVRNDQTMGRDISSLIQWGYRGMFSLIFE